MSLGEITAGWGRVRGGRVTHYFDACEERHVYWAGRGIPKCHEARGSTRVSRVWLPLRAEDAKLDAPKCSACLALVRRP